MSDNLSILFINIYLLLLFLCSPTLIKDKYVFRRKIHHPQCSNSHCEFSVDDGSSVEIRICLVQEEYLPIGEYNRFVTCGSVIKLMNTGYKVRLHSHDVKYGTGSGQQSVTGTELQEDVNSHWVIRAETKGNCIRGEPVKCGGVIRLQHLVTSKNLHSHHFPSPLSGNQEISAYGSEGEGDTGDHWTVVCDNDFWERNDEIMFKHIDTNVYLSVTSQTYGRPINGQHEVVGVDWPNGNYVQWKAMEGLFIHKSDFNPKKHVYAHTEL